MATRLIIMFLMALSIFAFMALTECALAASISGDERNNDARSLHQRLVKGLKGQWVSTWEYPVFQQGQLTEKREEASEKSFSLIASQSQPKHDAKFQHSLISEGFAILRVNGTLYWTNSTENTVSTDSVFGESPSDDTLIWSVTRPDRSVNDKVTVFETNSNGANNNANADEITPDFYFPFLEKKVLPFYSAFDGNFNLPSSSSSEEQSSEQVADNAAVSSTAKNIVTDIIPSYGYVLCSEQSSTVPTRPHRTAEGELFTTSRRVVVAGDAETAAAAAFGSQKKSLYITRTSVLNGVIFTIQSEKDVKMTAEEAEQKYCNVAEVASASSTTHTTPLTITTVGAATNSGKSTSIPFDKFTGPSRTNAAWDFDSIVFEFGLLPHEKKLQQAAVVAAAKSSAEAAAVEKVLSENRKSQRDALLAASAAFAEHPIAVAANTDGTEKKDSSAVSVSTLHHRITLRRLFRAEDKPIVERLLEAVDAYWRTALIAFGFIFFRFYVGYRYGSKKLQSGRKDLAEETTKMRQAALGKK